MSSDLEGLLSVLIVVTIIMMGNLNIYILSKTFNWFGSSTQKVDLTTKSEDNIYTKLAAGEYATSAKANQAAQEAALEAARVNQRTEELRLERVRLEKTS